MTQQAKILLVDDDKTLASITKEYLEVKGIDVHLEHDAQSALKSYTTHKFDICVLDVSMPFKDGFELAEEIRKIRGDASIIFLTAKKEKEDKIKGLSLGADDYVTKPFSMQELYLRISNVFKRIRPLSDSGTEEYEIGRYVYNSVSRKLSIDDEEERLSEMEGQLLIMFLNQNNNRITREAALNEIWQDEDQLKSRSLSVYINKLRHRLKKDPGIEIINVYGTGYQLVIN